MNLAKLFSKTPSSKEVAKKRLKLVIIHDRNDLSPSLLMAMRRDIIQALSKYVEIDTNALEVDLTRVSDDEGCDYASALVANIPIIAVKDMSHR